VRCVQINGENVATATHGRTVQLIRNSGDAICLKIITPQRRPRQRERVAVSCQQQEARLSAAGNGGPGRHRAQRTAAYKTPWRVSPPRAAVAHLRAPPHLTTARSMPDLSAAVDNNHNTSDHPRRQQNDVDDARTSAVADDRDRVLYELTNRLRPSPIVRQRPSLGGSSSAPRTDSGSRPGRSADESTTSPQRRPAPPPRNTSLSGRVQAPAPAAVSSTGSELKELLVVSGHAATSSQTVQRSVTSSPSTEARSTISGEHLVLPSQLKKLHRSPTNSQPAKQSKGDDAETGIRPSSSRDGGTRLNGVVAQHQAARERRLPAPKRPAPPPPPTTRFTTLPPTTRLTTPPATNGEVNFLVMAEEARKQYILSKLAMATIAANKTADNSSAVPANDKPIPDVNHELQKAVSRSAHYAETNGGSQLIANGKNTEHLHRPTSDELRIQTTSPQADDKDLHIPTGQTVEQAVNHSSPLESLLRSTEQPGESCETAPPPVIPPKRRPRNSSRVAACNNETANFERTTTSNVVDNGTDEVGLPQSHVSTDECSGAELSENCVVNNTQENLHTKDDSEHERRSNAAKLTRGKNVVVRRSGYSHQSADDMTAVNGDYPSTSDDKSRDDVEEIQRLSSVCDVGVLPPPPDFAD